MSAAEIKLRVPSMDCPSCVVTIQRHLLGMDGVIAVYRIRDRKEIARFEVTGSGVSAIAFSADNTTIVTGSAVITIHSLVTGLQREIREAEGATAVAIAPDGKRIAAAGDEIAREWLDDVPRDEAGLRAWIEQALK